jgi:hypothetical protein
MSLEHSDSSKIRQLVVNVSSEAEEDMVKTQRIEKTQCVL